MDICADVKSRTLTDSCRRLTIGEKLNGDEENEDGGKITNPKNIQMNFHKKSKKSPHSQLFHTANKNLAKIGNFYFIYEVYFGIVVDAELNGIWNFLIVVLA